MRHFIEYVILIIIILLQTNPVETQEVKILQWPTKYYTGRFEENDFAPSSEVEIERPWKVYSDRENNQTFTDPRGNDNFRSLYFLDDFFVIGEDGEYVRIAKVPRRDILKVIPPFEDYGWIHKSKLLLRYTCQETKDRIPRKAMVLNTIEGLLSTIVEGELDILKFKNSPVTNTEITGKEANLFDFYYIYKEESGVLLLGLQDRLLGLNREELSKEILGWAPISRLSLWDHRVAVESNWEPQAAEERRRGKKAVFFIDEVSAEKYRDGRNVSSNVILWNRDTFELRPSGEMRRFPILGTIQNDILKAGVMGKIYSREELESNPPESENIPTIDEEKVAKMRLLLNDLIESTRNINIIFVIDGTRSMDPYFRAISNSISSSINSLLKIERNKYKFGVVVYRDYVLVDSLLIEKWPLTSSDRRDEVIAFLNNIRCGLEYPRDTGYDEAMFWGIQTALREMSINPMETNILILVGDAGNYQNDARNITVNNIFSALSTQKIHFLVFQVHHDPFLPYDDFITQNKNIIRKTVDRQIDTLRNRFGNITQIQSPIYHETDTRLEVENGPYVNKMLGLPRLAVMDSVSLYKQVTNYIIQFGVLADSLAKDINDIITGQNTSPKPTPQQNIGLGYTVAFLELLSKVLPPDIFRIVPKKKIQLYHELTSTMKVRGQNEPLFKRVVLLSNRELGNLITSLDKLAKVATAGEREQILNTLIEIMRSYFGAIPEEQIREENLDRLHEMLNGLPLKNKELGKVRFRDIPDEIEFPRRLMRAYCDSLTYKTTALNKIYNEHKYPYSFRSNEQLYFWISEDDLP